MDTITILQCTGFAACFILLFVFIAKYHATVEDEQNFEEEVEGLDQTTVAPQEPTFTPRAALLQGIQGPAALEVADLKEQVKTLYYQLEELKVFTQKYQTDTSNQLARLEARLGTFEQEYVNKLQPTLLRVIDELEHIKGKGQEPSGSQESLPHTDAPTAEPNPAETPVKAEADEFPGRNPLVPELPEEELKF